MDIEIIETEHSKLTDIKKRLIITDIKNTNDSYHKLDNILIKLDRDTYYDNKQILTELMQDIIAKSFIEGQQSGRIVDKFIGVGNEFKSEEVYKKRSDSYVGD